MNIRFWDSKGIEKWSDNDVQSLLNELGEQQVRPLCVFYCATGNGRVESKVVSQILKVFVEEKITVFYAITNIYSLNNDQLAGQLDGALKIMLVATGKEGVKEGEHGKYFILCFI